MFQGFIPQRINAKSHPARQLAPISVLAQKPEMRQLRVSCASVARQLHVRLQLASISMFRGTQRASYMTLRDVLAAVIWR